MFEYFQEQNKWLTEPCISCGSVNHIFLGNENAHAWECWNCMEMWWLDDLAKDLVVIENNVDDDEALNMLMNYHPSIIFLHGQVVRT